MRHLIGVLVASALVLSGTPAAAAPTPALRFHSTQYDSPGKDDRSTESLNQEWISLVNPGKRPVNVNRWTVRDEAGRVHTFGNVTIPGDGTRIWLHTGSGETTRTDFFWASRTYIWNNTGDAAELRDAAGRTVDTCEWDEQRGRTWVGC